MRYFSFHVFRVQRSSSPVLFDHSLYINLQFEIVLTNSGSEIPSHKAIKVFFSIDLKSCKSNPDKSNKCHEQANHDQLCK